MMQNLKIARHLCRSFNQKLEIFWTNCNHYI